MVRKARTPLLSGALAASLAFAAMAVAPGGGSPAQAATAAGAWTTTT
jgi:hypothetical protein